MDYEFRIQDPKDPDTIYLYEEIIKQVSKDDLQSWKGVFAFTSSTGVMNVFEDDPVITDYINDGGSVDFTIGLSGVNDPQTLEELSKLEDQYSGFNVQLYQSQEGMFHPKVSLFNYSNGDCSLIVGSGNLTAGGLRNNVEAYSVVEGEADKIIGTGLWDVFHSRNESNLHPISQDIIDQMEEVQEQSPPRPKTPEIDIQIEEPVEQRDEDILIAKVPKAGGRWNQIHYNSDVIEEFFNLTSDEIENEPHRLFFRQVKNDGTQGGEEVRPVVYVDSNRNYKIEAGAKHGRSYPDEGEPIIIHREIGTRSYNYMLLFPDERGYQEMESVLSKSEAEGMTLGRGKPRTIVSTEQFEDAWRDCPLLSEGK